MVDVAMRMLALLAFATPVGADTHGGRHVVTALCSHHATHACGPFALIQVEDYALRGQNSR